MTDDLRTRIIAALLSEDDVALMADAVIRELPELTALRRCGRCRIPCLPDEYPAMSEASNELRPFCIRCTKLDRGRR